MKKFSATVLSREDFLAWIGGDHRMIFNRYSAVDKFSKKEGAITLLWDGSESNKEAQPLIAVPTDDLRDFFAFVGTYVTTFVPFSAFFRVVPVELVSALQERRQPVRAITQRIAKVAAGSALAELSIIMSGRTAERGAHLPAVTATLSASLGQAVIAGYPSSTFEWLADQWNAVHQGVNDLAIERSKSDQITSIWRLVSDAACGHSASPKLPSSRSERAILQFLIDAIQGQKLDKALFSLLTSSMSASIDAGKVLLASREDRIKAFNDFVVSIESSSLDLLSNQFMAGLLLAIAGNGSFDLLRSGRESLRRFPSSIVWFGICASLFDDSNILTTADCAGQHLVRDMQRPHELFDIPWSDLNSYEYRVLRRNVAALEQLSSRNHESLQVELLANATTYVIKGSGSRDLGLADDVEVLATSLQEIRSVVERAQRRLRYAPLPRQSELLRSDSKPRTRSRP